MTILALKQELPLFAQYLWNHKIDMRKANTVLMSEEKENLISVGLNKFEEFAKNLKKGDTSWFLDNINDDSFDPITEVDLLTIKTGEICKSLAKKIFNRIFNGNPVSKVMLTKHLKLYSVEPDRKADPNRTRIYKWST